MKSVYCIFLKIDSIEEPDKTRIGFSKFSGQMKLFSSTNKEKAIERYYKELGNHYNKPVQWVNKDLCDAYDAELILAVYDIDAVNTYGDFFFIDEAIESDSWFV